MRISLKITLRIWKIIGRSETRRIRKKAFSENLEQRQRAQRAPAFVPPAGAVGTERVEQSVLVVRRQRSRVQRSSWNRVRVEREDGIGERR